MHGRGFVCFTVRFTVRGLSRGTEETTAAASAVTSQSHTHVVVAVAIAAAFVAVIVIVGKFNDFILVFFVFLIFVFFFSVFWYSFSHTPGRPLLRSSVGMHPSVWSWLSATPSRNPITRTTPNLARSRKRTPTRCPRDTRATPSTL